MARVPCKRGCGCKRHAPNRVVPAAEDRSIAYGNWPLTTMPKEGYLVIGDGSYAKRAFLPEEDWS